MIERIKKIFGLNYTEKEISKLRVIVNDINHFYNDYDKLTDEELKAKTEEFKDRVQNKWETLDSILPEAFAVVKQACKRMCGNTYDVKWENMTWDMIPYDVQLIWWIILHQGKIAEMKTWEWKTLVATLPVYLNALEWKWVHVVTVNDYLASRDAAWMWKLYERLGLTVWCVVKWVPIQARKWEYEKDITYVENSELWFDYLRDNLVKTMKQRVLTRRPLNYAIVDEIDSILIDEARTPLIISEAREEATEKYSYYAKIVQALKPCSGKKQVSKWFLYEIMNDEKKVENIEDWDYYIDEKTKTVALSGIGIKKLEWILWVENLYKDFGFDEIHHIENALRAKAVYEKDKEYIVKDWEVLIVDEHTGRTMPGRRFSEWLHQAIEAKEWVEIKRESQTMATITYQNFFKQFKKMAWMTGTAVTEWEEFSTIYNLDVLEVPTNKETIRVDCHDKVYFNQTAKRKFVKEAIKFYHEIWQPILIWTANIATSEYLSKILEKDSINHYVLNAKFHEQEAHIVSNWWKYKSVIVATNMAWRWTDIKLEKGLNDKLADNYINWTIKNISNRNIKLKIYSSIEFDLTIDAIKRITWMSDDDIKQAELNVIKNDKFNLVIKFNTKRKKKTDVFAELYLSNIEWLNVPTISKELQYGLFVIGTEKHESRRIDNQLRWRSGRQWDPWKSVFYVALDDLLMRKMWWEKIMWIASMLMSKEDLENLELTQKQFTGSIETAQKQIEARNFSIRKHLFDYDSVIDKQRHQIYAKRDEIIEAELDEDKKENFVNQTKHDLKNIVEMLVSMKIEEAKHLNQTPVEFLETFIKEFNITLDKQTANTRENLWLNDLEQELTKTLTARLDEWFETLGNDRLYDVFRDIFLFHLDKLWISHIDEMQYLRDKVWFMWYAQQDPLIVYKRESFEKFQTLIYSYKVNTTSQILNLNFEAIKQQDEAVKFIIEKQKSGDKVFLEKLSKASGNLWEIIKIVQSEQNKIWNNTPKDKREMIFEDEDWFEIFEIDDENDSTSWTKSEWSNLDPSTPSPENTTTQSISSKKIRPNDKVTVKYLDGKIEYEVKYKKVKDDVESWKCSVTRIHMD